MFLLNFKTYRIGATSGRIHLVYRYSVLRSESRYVLIDQSYSNVIRCSYWLFSDKCYRQSRELDVKNIIKILSGNVDNISAMIKYSANRDARVRPIYFPTVCDLR